MARETEMELEKPMANRPNPTMYLRVGNPWQAMLSDATVLQLLDGAAAEGEGRLRKWIDEEEFGTQESLAQVLLDPTRPRHQRTAQDRVLAVILYGDLQRAMGLLPGAVAVADLVDRHRLSTSELRDQPICFGDGDFTGGEAVFYNGATTGGNGLTSRRNDALIRTALRRFVKSVNEERDRIRVMRGVDDPPFWHTSNNRHGGQYDLNLEGEEWHKLAA